MQNNKDLVAVIVNDFDYIQGGASKVAIETARLLHGQGYKVIFFSATHSDSQYVDYGYENITLNLPECLKDRNKIRGAISCLYNLRVKKEFKKLLNRLDKSNTIIHIHGWTKSLSSSIFDVIFKSKFKLVLTIHDYFTACPNGGCFNYNTNKICQLKGNSIKCVKTDCDSRNYAFKIYRCFRQFIQNNIVKLNKNLKNIIIISDFSFNVLRENLGDNKNIKKIYNPIDKVDSRSNRLLEADDYYLYVGRVSKEKGVELFCQSISELGYKGVVVGDGDELHYLKKKYPKIEYAGWQKKEVIDKYMRNAKALVFPSLWYEGAPLTILEAMSVGLPCIVSDVCAGKEFIEDKKNGLLFKGGCKDDLKNKLISYNEVNSLKFSEVCISKFNEYESISYIENIINAYESYIGDRYEEKNN
ncbi:Glycosyltransferase involved in cell wall bisynthesis [Terrisporobacter glycolicus]|nr:Glycosyltransferase involved in cell wall bisynthesis [Terrisporobacter glycolicus]